jgi:D-sedoheptulose 7-phosphate isomerase
MSQPLCEKCQKEPATILITELTEEGRCVEHHLCERCAAKETFHTTHLDAYPISARMVAGERLQPQVLCDRCKQQPATTRVRHIHAGATVSERNLCQECFAKETTEKLGWRLARAQKPGQAPCTQCGGPEPEKISIHEWAAEARSAILQSADVKRRFAEQAATDIAMAAKITAIALHGGHKVLLCGNGGSAAEAQHIAAELVGRFKLERPAFAAIALTTNSSILTAIANDYSFDDVFARAVQGLGAPGDVLFAYSTSGNSPNVLKAIEAAKTLGISTIGFTGSSGGRMAALCDLCIKVPSDDTPTVQECHTAAGHTICRLVERLLCQ